jgi:hypothetical protein
MPDPKKNVADLKIGISFARQLQDIQIQESLDMIENHIEQNFKGWWNHPSATQVRFFARRLLKFRPTQEKISSYNMMIAQIDAATSRYNKEHEKQSAGSFLAFGKLKTPAGALLNDIKEAMHRWIFTKKKKMLSSELMVVNWYISEDGPRMSPDEHAIVDKFKTHFDHIGCLFRNTNTLAFKLFDYIFSTISFKKDYVYFRSFFSKDFDLFEKMSKVMPGDLLFYKYPQCAAVPVLACGRVEYNPDLKSYSINIMNDGYYYFAPLKYLRMRR